MDKLLHMLNCLPLINLLELACHNKRKQGVYESTEEKTNLCFDTFYFKLV